MLALAIRHRLGLARGIAEDVAQVAGLAAVGAGVWMIYEPAGVIVGGLGLVFWAQGGGSDGGDST